MGDEQGRGVRDKLLEFPRRQLDRHVGHLEGSNLNRDRHDAQLWPSACCASAVASATARATRPPGADLAAKGLEHAVTMHGDTPGPRAQPGDPQGAEASPVHLARRGGVKWRQRCGAASSQLALHAFLQHLPGRARAGERV